MKRYDPMRTPDPREWLAMDEEERLQLVLEYHRLARVSLESESPHATIHAIVEAQIAMGDEIPAHRTLDRMLREGLDRHEAVHAIGSVLVEHMHNLLKDGNAGPDPNAPYFDALERLTAESWRRSG